MAGNGADALVFAALLSLAPMIPLVRAAGDASAAGTSSAAGDSSEPEAAALRVIAENVRVMMSTGDLESAAQEAERLVQRAPDSAAARLLAAEAYYRLGGDADVERHAAVASELEPGSAEGDRWRARLARWRGRLEDARRHLRRALERRPDSSALHAELGILYAAEGQTRFARRHFRRAVGGDLESPEMVLDAALALPSPRERNAALERLAEHFPDYAPAGAWAALCASVPDARLGRPDPWTAPARVPLELEQSHFPVIEARLSLQAAPEPSGGPPQEARSRNVRLLVDTGSPGLKISRGAADSLGARSFGTLRIGGMGSGRISRADLVLIDKLELGPIALRHVPAVVLDQLPFADGLLHPLVLGAEAVRFSVSERELVLGDNERLVPEKAPRLSFFELDQHLLVRLFLNGRARQAMIDSGSGATVLDRSVVRQIPDRRPMVFEGMEFSLTGVLGEVEDARPVHVTRLSLGAVEVSNPILFEADLSRFGQYLGTEVQILLGADALSRFDATFDFRNREITLEPAVRRRKRGAEVR
jgi:tetratricopeptide (TPR) repeat protein